MRKLIVFNNVTLNGYFVGRNGNARGLKNVDDN